MKITRIAVSRHSIALDLPFDGSWDTRPRTAFTAADWAQAEAAL